MCRKRTGAPQDLQQLVVPVCSGECARSVLWLVAVLVWGDPHLYEAARGAPVIHLRVRDARARR